MFSKIIKDFFLKKIVSKKLLSYDLKLPTDKIISVGVIVDDKFFKEIEFLKTEIEHFGIAKENIKILVYKNITNKKEVDEGLFLTLKDVKINGEISKKEINDFISYPFDLLINYYEGNNPVLVLLSKTSKSSFKVGFISVDKRVNDFIVDLHLNQYKEFVAELFKYLKILKKL